MNIDDDKQRAPKSMVDLSQIVGIRKYVSEFSSLESDYIFTRLTSGSTQPPLISGPLRVNGLVFCFVAKGFLKVDINLDTHKAEADTIITASSSSIINIREIDNANLDAYVLIVSPEFMKDINIDLNVLKSMRLPSASSPTFKLEHEETKMLLRYLELLHLNTMKNQDELYIRSISRCLLASVIYQLLQFASTHAPEKDEQPRALNRRSSYVRDFMELVHVHHKQERSVAFYAEKLFITPKYLSLIIKEATGRSAAEWIDDFVILEAKNMLRFSRKNIQQIAYELNFSNQSSFGKYFKNLTGMSPSVYQRT